MNLKPLSDRVIIRPEETDNISAGGIHIPDNAKEKPQRGEIIAIGPGKTEDGKTVALQVAKGDKVLFGKYAGTEITVDNVDYLIVRESDIMATL